MLAAVLATGAEPLEAILMVAHTHEPEAVLPLLLAELKRININHKGAAPFLAALAQVGLVNIPLAQMGLLAWFRNRLVGVKVDLLGLGWVESLPDGLTTTRLSLIGEPIRSLPGRLNVNNLDLRGCASWDGVVPEDAMIGQRIFTDRHTAGIPLASWRELHPRGEHA
jgi:hypothetical protein